MPSWCRKVPLISPELAVRVRVKLGEILVTAFFGGDVRLELEIGGEEAVHGGEQDVAVGGINRTEAGDDAGIGGNGRDGVFGSDEVQEDAFGPAGRIPLHFGLGRTTPEEAGTVGVEVRRRDVHADYAAEAAFGGVEGREQSALVILG